MQMHESTPRRGSGSTVTLTRKNSNVPHDPLPTTERGKRRAARRAAAAACARRREMLAELNVS